MNAPCARLTMFMMPHTSENPSATRARIPERSRALTASWPTSAPLIGGPSGSPLVPGRHRVERVLLGDGRRPDRVLLPVRLELLHDHRLERVDAAGVEADLAVEGHHV